MALPIVRDLLIVLGLAVDSRTVSLTGSKVYALEDIADDGKYPVGCHIDIDVTFPNGNAGESFQSSNFQVEQKQNASPLS